MREFKFEVIINTSPLATSSEELRVLIEDAIKNLQICHPTDIKVVTDPKNEF